MLKKIQLIKKKIREKLFKKPTQVILETTNHCNLNCPYCMVGMQNELVKKNGNAAHDLMTRSQGIMSKDTFDNVLKNLKDFKIKKVFLHFQGEPFLNKNTPLFAKILKDSGFEVGVFTNGLAFNDKNIREIADANLDLIRFSIDGASKESYEKNRVGGNFNKVIENLKKVAEAHKNKKTRIEWQFLALRNNEHEIETAKAKAEELGVNFFVKGFRETTSEFIPLNPKLRSKYLQKPCTDIYHQIGIYWNGDVVPCCYDVDGKEIFGNLNEASLNEIWKSDKYKRFRKNVNNSPNQPALEPVLCKFCLRWK